MPFGWVGPWRFMLLWALGFTVFIIIAAVAVFAVVRLLRESNSKKIERELEELKEKVREMEKNSKGA